MARPTAASRTRHPARRHGSGGSRAPAAPQGIVIPRDADAVSLTFGDRTVHLTNLRKPFWQRAGDHQGRSAPVLRRRRAGAAAAPARSRHGHEALSERRRGRLLLHEARARRRGRSGSSSARSSTARATSSTFRSIQDLPSLLWVINLGCIDLNQWYARCDDVDRPDYAALRSRSGAEGATSRRCARRR